MSLDPSKRLRFGGSKSRKGCLTCIERHLKCDEGTPNCRRCLKAGRVCKQRRASSESLRIVHYHNGPSTALSTVPDIDAAELRNFDFFRNHTASELAGVHYEEAWLVQLFRVANSEAAIYQAAAAVGAVHECFEQGSGQPRPSLTTFRGPLKQYTKAINKLMESMNRPNKVHPDTALLACLMFSAFESMSYHLHSALSHIQSGLKIMAEKSRDGLSFYDRVIPCSEMNSVFSRINIQLLELGEQTFDSTNIRLLGPDTSLEEFTDVRRAQQTFNPLLNNILHKLHNVHYRELDVHQQTPVTEPTTGLWLRSDMEAYQRWRDNFDRLVATRIGSCDAQDICSLIVLQLRRMMLNLILTVDLKKGEMDYDKYFKEYETMVQLGEEFVYHQSVPWDGQQHPTLGRTISGLDSGDAGNSPRSSERLTETNVGTKNMQNGFVAVHPSQTPLLSDGSLTDLGFSTSAVAIIRRSQELRQQTDGTLTPLPRTIKPSFCMAHGVVYPLYSIATRCREPQIRRRALRLLQRCNRREALWDSGLAACMASKIIEIEEGRTLQLLCDAAAACWIGMNQIKEITAAKDIPNGYRVRIVRPTYLPERKCIEQYYFSWTGSYEDARFADERFLQNMVEW